MTPQFFTVSDFVSYINDTLKAIWDGDAVAIEGEVSGFRVSQGQWVNFDIKDDGGLISAFMVLPKLRVPLEDGMKVRIYGTPRIYPKYGKFSFTVDRLELVGEGAIKKALAQLRAKLDTEGLFDPSRKRTLPRFPKRIALVASRESAAYGDIIRIINERWAGLEIELFHVVVQGDRAPASIIKALKQIQKREQENGAGYYDALVLTRGGGSFDELMAFNDEQLVRELYASKVPTMVAIGHERDTTLAEEVADVRGSTPTDCARRLVPDKEDVLYELSMLEQAIGDRMQGIIDEYTQVIHTIFTNVDKWLVTVLHRSQELAVATSTYAQHWIIHLLQRVDGYERFLKSVDPTAVMARGYAIIELAKDEIITSAKQLKAGQHINIRLRDGTVHATIDGEQATLL
ncbi:MAG: exodeoxyribonuclease VII large subunit [Candidatus Magasanikbacteria bacterium]|nr:exodeoxyribonuclease VII large subunit [Candidatus Magasanikbacteria bacterium]MCA9389214.1 exodeoxyribonuclease VII large subunit [Candidatus Magasanikbacteria bacterium]MCA9390843.1 exodeoxyribonuclease VII large subunit [Candidatus Magasanikbacteria bacterium]USN52211.1 MAG: exodeoxyribonuclease VII large subunit [Candidatus Nomurabacteria bacterium]HPF95078.1 exodeoxyribonuclease VII large subunit [bacterium]